MKFFFVCLVLLVDQFVLADLPIHVVLSDVKGLWKFEISKPKKDGYAACGGGVPNFNVENLEAEFDYYSKWIETNRENEKAILLQLTDKIVTTPNEMPPRNKWQKLAVLDTSNPSKVIGSWTMVYDEGFEVRIKNRTYFAFLKYYRRNSNNCPPVTNEDNENDLGETKCYETDPSRTLMGWYVEEKKNWNNTKNYWGCFYAEKQNNNEVFSSFVVQKIPDSSNILDDKFVENHNKESMSWIAEQHEQFKNLSFSERQMARKQLGYNKFHRLATEYRLPNFLQKSKEQFPYACKKQSSISMLRNVELPRFWSWGDPFISENWNEESDDITNQGNCGSCYALSSAYALQKRFEIMFNKLFSLEKIVEYERLLLSPQSIISCSPYNQGCDGGYPFLVGKHGKEFGFLTTNCMSYLATHSLSEAPCKIHMGDAKRSPPNNESGCSENERWYVKDYGYVGGCYECCNEDAMMHEIFLHGPIVVAIDAPEQLFLYKDGVFNTLPSKHGKICDNPGKGLNGWEYTNHAVAIVGWGEEDQNSSTSSPIKYWIVRNTWGKNWGKHGYFKVIRGKNFAGIESQAVYFDPDLTRGLAKSIVEEYRQRMKSKNENGKTVEKIVSKHF